MSFSGLFVCIPTLLTACTSAPRGRPVSDADLAITHVAVIDVERGRVVEDQDVLIKGDRIVAVVPSGQARLASTVRVVDGTRQFAMPGLLDMHVHLGPNPTRLTFPLFLAHGVTGVRVMSADRPSANPLETKGLDQHRHWQARVAAGTLAGPRLLALASWPVNGTAGITDSMPAFYNARTRAEGQRLARYFKERGFDLIKIYNNISREGYFGLAEEARALHLPFAGHEPAAVSAIDISNAGQRSIEHSRIFLFNCFSGADSLRKGLLRVSGTVRRRRMVDEYDPKVCANVFRTFARNGTYITPTHVTRRMDAFAGDSAYRHDPRLKYIPLVQQADWFADADNMVASDSSDAGRASYMDFYRKGLTLTNEAYRAGVPVMLGTDASDTYVFPGSSAHDELAELVKAGLSPAEALRTATLSGATYLSRTGDLGTVQAGRLADVVLLDANPLVDIANSRRIQAVVMNGRMFQRAALDSMLASVEAAARPDNVQRLWFGSARGDTAMIAGAVAHGAPIDSLIPEDGLRALDLAARENRGAAARLLLALGAKPDLAGDAGFTPLHRAAETQSLDVLRILIAAGADVTRRSTGGETALDVARKTKNQAAIDMLEAAVRNR